MVKRVFKNKRLIRNILILAGLVIVGFFLWRAFVWTRLLEGMGFLSEEQIQANLNIFNLQNAALSKCRSIDDATQRQDCETQAYRCPRAEDPTVCFNNIGSNPATQEPEQPTPTSLAPTVTTQPAPTSLAPTVTTQAAK